MNDQKPIRVIIVDDHAVVRSGLSAFLMVYDDLDFIGEAASGEGVQNSIIEITRLFGLSPGYWKHNVKVYNGGPGSYSGTPLHESNETMESYAATILAAHQAEITSEDPNVDTVEEFLTWANIRFQDNAFKKGTPSWLELANWFNAAAGRSPYVDTD